ncbi:MAG: allophanate hydrolase, partial [Gemmatimonadaceae bacterium]|nr:allophanate hydrolase [Acetobacteraceae bacterium]
MSHPLANSLAAQPGIVSPDDGIAGHRHACDPARLLDEVFDRIAAQGERPVWISLVPRAHAQAMLADATRRHHAGESLPLLGVPFALKDNIDLAGLPTTAGCPDFAYTPDRSAFAVERLIAAGAVPVGKTNLDQFATGLNGTRSPYGIPASVFDPARVSGGSSSGSAVAVASGLVPFALGTDTAGSGRVPAAFNNLVGLKPTKGLVSTRGIVPACRSQDCPSIFATTVGDALAVARVIAGFDPDEPYSRAAPDTALASVPGGRRFGVPAPAWLEAIDDTWRPLFETAANAMEALGGTRVTIDFAPFAAAA